VKHAILAALTLIAAGCGGSGTPPAPASGPLPPGVVARVGSREITADRVARIAAAQKISLKDARDAAIRDELFAEGALARGLDLDREVLLSTRGELARRMLRKVLADARATPATEPELTVAAARRWLDVDRPEGFRTVHAVVRFAASDDDAKKARARAVAEAIRAKIQPIAARAPEMPIAEDTPRANQRTGPNSDPDPLSAAFRKAVLEVPTDGLEVVAEPLPPVSAEARVLVPGDNWFDQDFARAASTLKERGDLSPLVTSTFGVHVILLLERTPPNVLTGEARAARLFDDIVNERARAAQKRLLAPLRAQARVEIAADAQALISLVAVDP
jgi:peptidyl-prolyl cis-trans isomerase C